MAAPLPPLQFAMADHANPVASGTVSNASGVQLAPKGPPWALLAAAAVAIAFIMAR